VPAGINEDIDASVEPRRGRNLLILAGSITRKRKNRKKQTKKAKQKSVQTRFKNPKQSK